MYSKPIVIKYSVLVLMVMMVLLNSNYHWANSGPVRMESWPAAEMVIDDRVEVGVTLETLQFDFSDALSYYAPIAKVDAVYTMKHMGADHQSVQMMFPLVTNLLNLYQTVHIASDQNEVDFTLYVGDASLIYQMADVMPFEHVLNALKPLHASRDNAPDIWLYEIETQHDSEKFLEYIVRYDSPENTQILAPFFLRSYGGNPDGQFLGFSSFNSDDPLYFYAIGDPLENVEILDETSDNTLAFTIKAHAWPALIDSLTAELDDVIESISLNNDDFYFHIENALFSHISKYPNEVIELGYLTNYFYEPQLFSMLFNIDFEAYEEKNIHVQYQLEGTMDRSKSYEPTYAYHYFLSPAKHWAFFESLEVTIIPPEKAPYLISSSIPLSQEGSLYSANLSGIPTDVLSFILHEKPEITSLEAFLAPKTRNIGYLLFFLIPMIIGTFVIVAISLIFRKLLKRGNHTL